MDSTTPVDIGGQSNILTGTSEEVRRNVAEMGRQDLFFLNKVILGYKDMTSTCHGPLCTFYTDNMAQFKLMLMPRDHFKTSTITVGGSIQGIIRDVNSRRLLANESASNAERMLRTVRQHAESNSLFRALYGSVIPRNFKQSGLRWNDSELDFVRTWIGPEPTLDSIGMTGAFTSRHYTDITVDDPISEEAVKSEKVMNDTIERFKGFLSLLVKPETDKINLVGTRWALHDIYSWARKNLGLRLAIFGRSAFLPDGTPLFPELMSLEILALKRQALGEYKFSCLYMNNPRDENIQDLNVNHLRYWRWRDAAQTVIEMLDPVNGDIKTIHLAQLDITTTVDLAPAETINSDRNAIVTTGVTPWGDCIVLDAFAKRCSPLEVIEHLIYVHHRFGPRVMGIEAVAYQKAFKWFLKAECERRGIFMNVRDLKAIGKKETRVRGLQPILATGRMYIHPTQQMLRNEMADFPLGEHDDVVDALSMQQQVWIGVMSPESRARTEAEQKLIVARMMHPGEDPDELDADLVWQQIMNGTQQTYSLAFPT